MSSTGCFQSLQGASDRVEQAELGIVYVGLDGLETMYGGEARLVTTLLNTVPTGPHAPRRRGRRQVPGLRRRSRISQPLGATKVPTDVAGFLAPQPVDLLPIPPTFKDELRRFGLRTLG